MEQIYSKLDMKNTKIVSELFIDLNKAFDTVDHLVLLRKLEQSGIRGISNTLMQSYLCQYGSCNGKSVSVSVPQWSPLVSFLRT